jgi:hypothetical protein
MELLEQVRGQLRRAFKDLTFRSPLARFVAPRWQYNHSPAQLAFLCNCIDQAKNIPGAVYEVGCFAGATTVFLSRHMSDQGIQKDYYAFDTFEGFTRDDVDHEVNERGKARHVLDGFTDNKQSWFDRTMALNGFAHVRSVRADVTRYDFSQLEAPAFCLVDVDLYRPVRGALEALYDRVPSGAIFVVDDCMQNNSFDGALHAYQEFVAARGLPERIEHRKFGVIVKP